MFGEHILYQVWMFIFYRLLGAIENLPIKTCLLQGHESICSSESLFYESTLLDGHLIRGESFIACKWHGMKVQSGMNQGKAISWRTIALLTGFCPLCSRHALSVWSSPTILWDIIICLLGKMEISLLWCSIFV